MKHAGAINMKICSKAGHFSCCEYCWHSTAHEEITDENVKLFPRKSKEMLITLVCSSVCDCFGDNGKSIKVKCVEFREDEDKVKEIMTILKCSRAIAINVLDKFDDIKFTKDDEFRESGE